MFVRRRCAGAFLARAVAAFVAVTAPGVGRADEPAGGKGSGPWDLAALRRPPAVTVAEPDKALSAVYYEGEPYHGKPTRVFAYLARPGQAEGKRPAMVVVHGGGG